MLDRTRRTADLVSDNNLYVDIATDRVGIGTTVPTQKLEVNGSVRVNNDLIVTTTNITSETHKVNTTFNTRTVTNNYTVSRDDGTIFANGNLTITMPTCIGYSGDKYFIKNVGISSVRIVGTGTEKIDGYSEMIIEDNNSSLGLLSNGSTGWFIF